MSKPGRSTASIPAQDKHAIDWSHFNQPLGELKPATFTPTQQIGYAAADALFAAGMQPYYAKDLTRRIGALLGLTPLGAAGSALDLIDAKRRGDIPGAVLAAAGTIPPAKGVGQIAAEEARALTDKVLLSPASRAARKGCSGVGTTAKGGPTFVGTRSTISRREQSVAQIKLTGSRRADIKRANEVGGFTETPAGYMWHHVDDFDPQAGTGSL